MALSLSLYIAHTLCFTYVYIYRDSRTDTHTVFPEGMFDVLTNDFQGGGIFGGLIASVTSTLSSFGQGAAPLTTRAHREAVARAIRRKKSRLALCHLLCLPDEEISAFILSKRILEDIVSDKEDVLTN